ncbi:MAG: hypothetical protein ACYCZ7_00820 [Minisyncoccota bacterium]
MLKLIVAQVDRILFQGEVAQVTCPGEMGELTVLAHHAPLVTSLKNGELKIVDSEGKEIRFSVESGILEVGSNEASVLL